MKSFAPRHISLFSRVSNVRPSILFTKVLYFFTISCFSLESSRIDTLELRLRFLRYLLSITGLDFRNSIYCSLSILRLSLEWSTGLLRFSMYRSSIEPWRFILLRERLCFIFRCCYTGFCSFFLWPPAMALACLFIVEFIECFLADLEDLRERKDRADGILSIYFGYFRFPLRLTPTLGVANIEKSGTAAGLALRGVVPEARPFLLPECFLSIAEVRTGSSRFATLSMS